MLLYFFMAQLAQGHVFDLPLPWRARHFEELLLCELQALTSILDDQTIGTIGF